MINIVKTIKKLSAIIGLAAFIFTANLSWAWDIVFADYFIHDLKVIEVDVESETVTLKSPDGEIATLTVGDVIGQGAFTISVINKRVIELESVPDDRGRTRKHSIGSVRIDSLEDCTYLDDLKPSFKKNR